MDEKIVKLKYPIPIPQEGKEDITTNELRLGRFKSKHLKLLPDNFDGNLSPREIIPLIAGLANIPEASADEIDIADLEEVVKELQSFFEGFQETGKK